MSNGSRPRARYASSKEQLAIGLYLLVLVLILIVLILMVWPRKTPLDEKQAAPSPEEIGRAAADEFGDQLLKLLADRLARTSEEASETDSDDGGPSPGTPGGSDEPDGPPSANGGSGTTGSPARTPNTDSREDLSAFADLNNEVRLLVIALLFGALGSWLHASASFVSFVGARRFKMSWTWWYIVRPFIGGGLGLLFYMVLRAGLVTTEAAPQSISQFGVAALAGLAGLSTEQATKKLREVFDAMFKTDRAKERDPLYEPGPPVIESIEPKEVKVGDKDEEVTIRGERFRERQTEVFIDGVAVATDVESEEQLTFTLPKEKRRQPGKVKIEVKNPAPNPGDAAGEIEVV